MLDFHIVGAVINGFICKIVYGQEYSWSTRSVCESRFLMCNETHEVFFVEGFLLKGLLSFRRGAVTYSRSMLRRWASRRGLDLSCWPAFVLTVPVSGGGRGERERERVCLRVCVPPKREERGCISECHWGIIRQRRQSQCIFAVLSLRYNCVLLAEVCGMSGCPCGVSAPLSIVAPHLQ